MPELALIMLGLIASIVLCGIKGLFAVVAFGWLACWIPLLIAVVIVCLMNGADLFDFT